MKPIRLTLTQTPDGLKLEFQFAYVGRLPTMPKRRDAMLSFLRESLEGVGSGKLTEIGHADGESPKQRRDVWLLEEDSR